MTASHFLPFLFLLVLWLPPGSLGEVVIYQQDPYSDQLLDESFVPEEEPFTNLTIDELISQSYEHGAEGYMSDHFMNADGSLLAELDMRLEPDQFQDLYGGVNKRKKRKATRPLRLRWTNGIIPYEFVSSHFSAQEVYTIKKALQEWTDATCLTFRPATHNDRNKIRFQNGQGCNSALGMVGGTQVINLQTPGCRYKGLYLHEVGHALGLVHEHQLPDRDTYITILYNNVSPSMRIWFNKYSTREVNQYGVPYEYSSVMHYGIRAFSHDGRSQTIRAKDQSREAEIGNVWRKGLSFSDIKVVNLMYQCNRNCTANPSCKDPGFLDKNCRCVCPSNVDCTQGGGGGGGGGGTANCTNKWPGNQCDVWARRGECDNNPTWMRDNCQKSCNTCPTVPPTTATTAAPATTTTTTPATTTTTTSATTTIQGSTPTTSTSGTATTTYMPSPPPSSTAAPTTTTTAPCVNQWGDYRCNYWQRVGECTNNSVWMRQHCTKACTRCTGGGGEGGGGGGRDCRNHHHLCQYWSNAGYCGRSAYMTRNCRRACNSCG